jgi:general secretion pathway protein G
MEVLLAIAMISLLAFIVVINVDKTMTSSQEKITESFVNNSLATPLMSYKLAIGKYPSTEEGLNALLNAPESAGDRWKGPYVRSLPLDPWGNPYQYRYPAQKSKDGYDVWSMGPDGQNETEDDIGNW